MTKKKKSPLLLTMLVVVVTLASLAVVEIVLQLLPERAPSPLLGQLSYETSDGQPVANLQEASGLGFIMEVPGKTPRPRHMFAPSHSFYLRYTDRDTLGCDWMDEQGRVFVRINEWGIREREEITPSKPNDQQRIVCVGDSFTFGWGVPEEMGWVRMLEDELRKNGSNVRTVNCGAAGTVVIDEYWWGLQHRFAKFDPDSVIVTICLNDLIPCSGLFVQGPAPDTGWKLVDLILGALGYTPLELDPSIDWVDLLLNYPKAEGEEGGIYSHTNPFEAMWAQGLGEHPTATAPQPALAAMKTWCDTRNIKLLVVLWPFLQGLGPGRYYPFEKLHGLVEAECQRLEIPFHDVLPALRDTPSEDLWVTPADMHANPTAHRLALPGIVNFVR